MKKFTFQIVHLLLMVTVLSLYSFSQQNMNTVPSPPMNLLHKDYKLAKKKGLADIEMIWLKQKGYTNEAIKKTPLDELRKNMEEITTFSIEKQLMEVKDRTKVLESYIKDLEEKIKALEEQRN
jgi:septal ring factor EnvC (AmiA/AmiB activator)